MSENPEWLFNGHETQRTYTSERYTPVVTPVWRWTRERWESVRPLGKAGVIVGLLVGLSWTDLDFTSAEKLPQLALPLIMSALLGAIGQQLESGSPGTSRR